MKIPSFNSSFFQLQDADDVVVLQVTRPQLTDEDNLEQLDRDFSSLTDTYHCRKIVLDLSPVAYMTSAAIGKLISFHRRLSRGGGLMVLCSLQQPVAAALSASHLTDYFAISPSPDAAMGQFS
jgi:anti-sigma B factor antagonist